MISCRKTWFGVLFVGCLVLSGCPGHPYPIDEAYEVLNPITTKPVILFRTWLWPTDDRTGLERPYLPSVRFRDTGGTIWEEEFWSDTSIRRSPEWSRYYVVRRRQPEGRISEEGEPATHFPISSVLGDDDSDAGRQVTFFDANGVRWVVVVAGVDPEQWSVHRIGPDQTPVPVPIKEVDANAPHPLVPEMEGR